MRIRHVLPQPALGVLPYDPLNEPMTGVVGIAWSLALTQAAAGHEVEIVGPGANGPRSATFAGVRVTWLPRWHRLNTARLDASDLAPLWFHTLRSAPVDVAHVHGNPYFMIRHKSRGRVFHLNDSSVQPARRMEQALARADRILVCSNYIRQELLGRVRYPAEQVQVFAPGVDWRLHAAANRAAARASFDITDDRLVLVFAARMAPEKGLTVLFEAFRKLAGRISPEPLLLVAGSPKLGMQGAPDTWGRLEAYAQEVRTLAEGLPVRFVGNLPRRELPRLYSAGDIFVTPSLWQEPFGMVSLESQACGVPVVAFAVGGIPDLVQHEVNGLLVPPGDADALAAALYRLMTDHALRARLGATARETSAHLDWELLARRLDVIYSQVLQSPSGMRTMVAS